MIGAGLGKTELTTLEVVNHKLYGRHEFRAPFKTASVASRRKRRHDTRSKISPKGIISVFRCWPDYMWPRPDLREQANQYEPTRAEPTGRRGLAPRSSCATT